MEVYSSLHALVDKGGLVLEPIVDAHRGPDGVVVFIVYHSMRGNAIRLLCTSIHHLHIFCTFLGPKYLHLRSAYEIGLRNYPTRSTVCAES